MQAHEAGLVHTSRIITGIIGMVTMGIAILSTLLGRGLVEVSIAALGLTQRATPQKP